MDRKGKGVHKVERSSELGRVHTAEGQFAVRVVDRGGWLEGDADFVSGNEPLAESIVGDGGNAVIYSRDESS